MFTCSCQQTSCLSLSIGNKKLSRFYKNLILNQVATEIAGLSEASWSRQVTMDGFTNFSPSPGEPKNASSKSSL